MHCTRMQYQSKQKTIHPGKAGGPQASAFREQGVIFWTNEPRLEDKRVDSTVVWQEV